MTYRLVPLAVILLAGCASTVTPQYDMQFGEAVRQARLRQTLNPAASAAPAQPLGLDGKVAEEAMNLYRNSFKAPPPVVNVINIGGSVGGGGSR
jgi:hypothetical protein